VRVASRGSSRSFVPMKATARPVALVTGASAGLGREFAVQLARRGYDLVLVARDIERLNALASELRDSHGANAEVLRADLTRDDEVSTVVERIDSGPIDLLVNNAGFGTRGSIASATRADQEAMLRVHVLAAHRLAQAAVQKMAPLGRGAIINVSSIASWLISPGNVNYSATKAWQRVFAESLALEVRGKGIYVQALCPGYTHTEFHQRGGMDKKRVPDWWWMNADQIVAESLTAFDRGRPVVVVPGTGYKVAALIVRFLPRWLWRLMISSRPRGSGAPTP
jgi:short-subunit dehydrogenase